MSDAAAPRLLRRLGPFDATMLVMGGIVGAGIFVNPAEVARAVQAPWLIVGAWVLGGVVAMAGALVYAELAVRRPETGGQYAYLRDAWGPIPAFLYGWSLLLVIQSGGMAAVAITFSRYFLELARWPVAESLVAALVLAILTAVNCIGVKAGSNVQSALMLLKILAIVALVLAGLAFAPAAGTAARPPEAPLGLLAAMTPVMFAYGGWQTTSFIAGEMRDPRRDLSRGVLLGVAGVVLLYCAVAFVCVHALGPAGLAAAKTPASDVMRAALGPRGGTLIALGIAVSTLGFLSQSMLTTPRVYFAMAQDRLFFPVFARIGRRSAVPVFAIALQGAAAIVIAVSGTYGQILNYVVSVDFIFFGLTGAALFAFRARGIGEGGLFRVPGHPFTTGFFVAACWLVVAATVWSHWRDSLVGFAILACGLPACFYWMRRRG
ncbi:MAG: amino acid permease [Alphaproteobacteria bacterium]|nr:amino acid permease [Alphaproteobacteria bacterium]MBV9371466.1 amino acid permease [Alphaproteobacteria bacterium]MBV9902403.1 amino acid permease [Alphaproteobacteria bacterium]